MCMYILLWLWAPYIQQFSDYHIWETYHNSVLLQRCFSEWFHLEGGTQSGNNTVTRCYNPLITLIRQTHSVQRLMYMYFHYKINNNALLAELCRVCLHVVMFSGKLALFLNIATQFPLSSLEIPIIFHPIWQHLTKCPAPIYLPSFALNTLNM